MFKDQKHISIIPLVCNITWDQLRKINENNVQMKDITKETINDVNYLENLTFIIELEERYII